MKWHPLLLVFITCTFLRPQAQNTLFLSEGKITFEKKTNLYEQIQEDDDNWSDLVKKSLPRFRNDYFELLFTKNKTLYQPGAPNPENDKIPDWIRTFDNNIVFSDLEAEKSIARKEVFEQPFIIEDSTRQIHWKITDEVRTIAGFSCRRANAIVMDSVYVVAYYTDEITTPGGPESFTGLPGMILGVAIPHEHITWFATKVQAAPMTDADLKIPVKGKKTTRKELGAMLADRMKDWGKGGRRFQLVIML
jgi:GLPGLI family protein